jgi:hypothetical protein
MKKFIILFLGCSVIALAGCKKDLTISNPNTPTVANFWKTSNDALLGINAAYSTFHREGISRWLYFMTMIRADEGFSTSPNPAIVNIYDAFNITDYNDYLVTSVWQDDYIGINRANQVLDNVPGINMDDALRQQYISEAQFLRGWFYYSLATLYGNVPILLHSSESSDQPATAPQAQVFAQAAADFTAAAAGLPVSYDAANVGRATKGAAYAMLGKTYLQLRQYQQAHDALQWLTEGPGAAQYSLTPSYRDNFIETAENNPESVFEIQFAVNPNDAFDNDQGDGDPSHTPDRLNYGTSIPPFFAPSPIGFTDGQARRWVVSQFLGETTTTGARDPRLAATFLYDSTDPRGPAFTQAYGRPWDSLGLQNTPDNIHNSVHEVCFRKELDDATMNGEVFHSGNNWRYIRYADVLLLYAEALNGLGQDAAAYPFVDRVRTRAGLAPLSTARPGLTGAAFLDQLKHERITELTGEGHRWEDLARWGDLNPSIASRDPGFANFVIGKDEFLPIPQSEIDLNPNLQQNPGW